MQYDRKECCQEEDDGKIKLRVTLNLAGNSYKAKKPRQAVFKRPVSDATCTKKRKTLTKHVN